MRLRVIDRRTDRSWQPPAELIDLLAHVCGPAGREEWLVDLVWVQDEKIRELNQQYRGQNQVTDVLSFSYLDNDGNGAPALTEGTGYARRDLWLFAPEAADDSAVGEVLIAPAFVAARCRAEKWALRDEMALLMVHGVLHILGWEHDDAPAKAAMRLREQELLQIGAVQHPLLRRGQED